MKILFVCNTVYQILVASWIKHKEHADDECDMVISNHMNNSELLCANMKRAKIKNGERPYNGRLGKLYYDSFPSNCLDKYICLEKKYDALYIANFDRFNALIYDVLKRRNRSLKLFVYEDGLSTYGLITKGFYDVHKPSDNPVVRFVHNRIYRRNSLYQNVDCLRVFDKSLCEWTPDCDIEQIERIDVNDTVFKQNINTVFDYDSLEDSYEEQYIFFEESYFADYGYMEDVNLVERIAEKVGKENLLIKMHPRNPENRFKEIGYKTNINTAIPWEVIALNLDLSQKTLITISSSSLISANRVLSFQSESLISCLNCVNSLSKIVKENYFSTVLNIYSNYHVRFIHQINEL